MAEQRYKIGALPTRNITTYTTTTYLTATFRQLEIVNIGNNVYQSLVDNNVGNALTDASKWVCLVNNDSYIAAEAARQESFVESQAARTEAFNEAEAGRAETFRENEAERQAAIDAKLAEINAMEFDNTPTQGSNKAVKSGGLFDKFAQVEQKMVDSSFYVEFKSGKYITSDGRLLDATTYNYTELIPVNVGDKFLYSGSTGVNANPIAGYATDKSYVESLLSYGDHSYQLITIPEGVEYVCFCGRNETFSVNTVAPKAAFIESFNNYKTNNKIFTQQIDVCGYLVQGNASNKGVVSQDSYYNIRVSCIINVKPFRVRKTRLFAIVDNDKIIRNFAFYNTKNDTTSGWYFFNGNSSNFIEIETNDDEEIYDRIIITIGTSDLTSNISTSDVKSLNAIGVLANLIFPDINFPNEFYGKKYSVMGDSIGTNNTGDTPLYTITANDVGHEITSWITWFDYNNSTSDTASGTSKTIGGVAITSAMVGTQQTFTPTASDIGKTLGTPRWSYNQTFGAKPWWKIVGETLGMVFDSSASWNGNSYCSHEENDNLRKIGYGWHPLQIARLANRDSSGNRITPDVIFLCRGTNDATHTPYAKITDFGSGIDQIPANDTVNTNQYGFKEALAKTVASIQQTYPNAKIFISTLTPLRRLNDDTFPMDNGTSSMQEYNNAVKEVAEYMGCNVIDFSKCWTFYNCASSGYVNSSDYTHPLQKGHNAMAEQALKDLNK